VILLIRDEIIYINKRWISEYGGIYFVESDNINNKNSFDFLLTAPTQEIFGTELYPNIFIKAATYPFYIIKDHLFYDGNKRTGMMSAFLFLEKNGFKVMQNVTSKRIINYAKKITGCKPTIKNVSNWLRKISVKPS